MRNKQQDQFPFCTHLYLFLLSCVHLSIKKLSKPFRETWNWDFKVCQSKRDLKYKHNWKQCHLILEKFELHTNRYLSTMYTDGYVIEMPFSLSPPTTKINMSINNARHLPESQGWGDRWTRRINMPSWTPYACRWWKQQKSDILVFASYVVFGKYCIVVPRKRKLQTLQFCTSSSKRDEKHAHRYYSRHHNISSFVCTQSSLSKLFLLLFIITHSM